MSGSGEDAFQETLRQIAATNAGLGERLKELGYSVSDDPGKKDDGAKASTTTDDARDRTVSEVKLELETKLEEVQRDAEVAAEFGRALLEENTELLNRANAIEHLIEPSQEELLELKVTVKELMEENDGLRAKSNDLMTSLRQMEKKYSVVSRDNAEITLKCEVSQAKCEGLTQDVSQLRDELTALNVTIDQERAQTRVAQKARLKLERDCAKLLDTKERLEGELAEQAEEIDELLEQRRASSKNDPHTHEIKQLKSEINKLELELLKGQESMKAASAVEEECGRLKRQLAEESDLLSEARSRIASLQQELDDQQVLADQAGFLGGPKDSLFSELESATTRTLEESLKGAELAQEMFEASAEHAKQLAQVEARFLEQERLSIERGCEIDVLRERVEELKEQLAAQKAVLSSDKDKLRADLHRFKQANLRGQVSEGTEHLGDGDREQATANAEFLLREEMQQFYEDKMAELMIELEAQRDAGTSGLIESLKEECQALFDENMALSDELQAVRLSTRQLRAAVHRAEEAVDQSPIAATTTATSTATGGDQPHTPSRKAPVPPGATTTTESGSDPKSTDGKGMSTSTPQHSSSTSAGTTTVSSADGSTSSESVSVQANASQSDRVSQSSTEVSSRDDGGTTTASAGTSTSTVTKDDAVVVSDQESATSADITTSPTGTTTNASTAATTDSSATDATTSAATAAIGTDASEPSQVVDAASTTTNEGAAPITTSTSSATDTAATVTTTGAAVQAAPPVEDDIGGTSKNVSSELAEAQSDLDALRQRFVSQIDDLVVAHREELQSVHAELDEFRVALEAARDQEQKMMDDRQAYNTEQVSSLEDARAELAEQGSVIASLQTQLETAWSEARGSRLVVKQLEHELSSLKTEHQQVLKALTDARSKQQAMEQQQQQQQQQQQPQDGEEEEAAPRARTSSAVAAAAIPPNMVQVQKEELKRLIDAVKRAETESTSLTNDIFEMRTQLEMTSFRHLNQTKGSKDTPPLAIVAESNKSIEMIVKQVRKLLDTGSVTPLTQQIALLLLDCSDIRMRMNHYLEAMIRETSEKAEAFDRERAEEEQEASKQKKESRIKRFFGAFFHKESSSGKKKKKEKKPAPFDPDAIDTKKESDRQRATPSKSSPSAVKPRKATPVKSDDTADAKPSVTGLHIDGDRTNAPTADTTVSQDEPLDVEQIRKMGINRDTESQINRSGVRKDSPAPRTPGADTTPSTPASSGGKRGVKPRKTQIKPRAKPVDEE